MLRSSLSRHARRALGVGAVAGFLGIGVVLASPVSATAPLPITVTPNSVVLSANNHEADVTVSGANCTEVHGTVAMYRGSFAPGDTPPSSALAQGSFFNFITQSGGGWTANFTVGHDPYTAAPVVSGLYTIRANCNPASCFDLNCATFSYANAIITVDDGTGPAASTTTTTGDPAVTTTTAAGSAVTTTTKAATPAVKAAVNASPALTG